MFPIPAPKDLSGESEVTALVLRQKQKIWKLAKKYSTPLSFTQVLTPYPLHMLNHPLTAISKPAC